MAREMKDSGVAWIDRIPIDWQTKNIRALFSFGKGLPITKDNLRDSGISVISYGQIHSKQNPGTHLEAALFRYVDEEYLNSHTSSLVHPGDFIFADTSEDLEGCGNCAYVNADMTLFAGYHTIILQSKDSADNRYFAYLFKSDGWRRQIRERVTGVKLFSVSQKILKDVSLIVPPKDVQCTIANYLDLKCAEIYALSDKIRTSIEEYKKLKQAIITQTVTGGIRGDSDNWKQIKIKWLLTERKERSAEGAEEPLSMSQKYGIVPTREMDIVPNMASSFVGAKLVYCGDLVFNKLKAHLGVFSVSPYDGLVSPDYAVYCATELADAKYLEHLFKTPQYISEFKKRATGIAVGLTCLYTDDLYSITCALPSVEKQQEIVRYLGDKVGEMNTLIQKKERFLAELETYKKSLIYEYVTGKRS